MNVGHFSYLLDGARTPQVKTAADRLDLLAKTAAKRYLEERAPLNQTIAKIAKENDLNGNQIERVCEMANIATHQGLWSKTAAKDKVAFELADARQVKQACGCGEPAPDPCGGPGPGPMLDSDYAGPPKGIPGGGPSLADAMGVNLDGGHNGLSDVPEKKKIIIILQKQAAERQRLADKVLLAGVELESLEKKAYHAVKQTVLGGASFRQVYTALCAGGLQKEAAEYLPKFQDALIKETHGEIRTRLEKLAIAKAPADLISENLGNTVVINGAHPVLVSLDTIRRKTGEIRNGLQGLVRIDDEAKVYHQKIRDLSGQG